MAVGTTLEEMLAAIKDHSFVGKENKSKRVKRSSTTKKPDNHIGCHVCIRLADIYS